MTCIYPPTALYHTYIISLSPYFTTLRCLHPHPLFTHSTISLSLLSVYHTDFSVSPIIPPSPDPWSNMTIKTWKPEQGTDESINMCDYDHLPAETEPPPPKKKKKTAGRTPMLYYSQAQTQTERHRRSLLTNNVINDRSYRLRY